MWGPSGAQGPAVGVPGRDTEGTEVLSSGLGAVETPGRAERLVSLSGVSNSLRDPWGREAPSLLGVVPLGVWDPAEGTGAEHVQGPARKAWGPAGAYSGLGSRRSLGPGWWVPAGTGMRRSAGEP